MNWLWVFLGGGLGAVARHGVGRATLATFGPAFPWGTLAVNVVGGLLIGMLAGGFAASGTEQPVRLFLVTGFLGGFTTFSAFSLDALTLWSRDPRLAAAYVAASIILSIGAAVLGMSASKLA